MKATLFRQADGVTIKRKEKIYEIQKNSSTLNGYLDDDT